MSLSTSIELAVSGLRATQAGMDVVSQNVANAGSAGYTRRVLNQEQKVADGRTAGVLVSGATRVLDTMIQRQLRLEQAGASYTGVRAAGTSALNGLFDSPGAAGSLPTLLNSFTQSLQTLANSPSPYANRATVLFAATDLAASLNGLADQVQSLRQSAEDAIGAAVGKADSLLQQIADANAKVVADPGSAALQDQRDALIDQLSGLVDVKVVAQPGGSVTLSTTGGLQLFDGAVATRLSFDPHTPLSAQTAYDTDPARRGVGTVVASDGVKNPRDVVALGLIRSGEIAAQLELRDVTLVRAQRQLDELAAGLAASLSDKQVTGTAATAGGASGFDLDLSGLKDGNTVSVTVNGPGGQGRTVTFVKTQSAAAAAAASSADGGTVGLDASGGPASIAAQVAAALEPGYAVSNPAGATLRILDDGAAGTTDVLGLVGAVTVTGLATGDAELPLFVDAGRSDGAYTGSFETGSQLTGFASRIAVNPAVRADPSSLVVYGAGTLAGDATRPLHLLDRLTTSTRRFSGEAAISGSTSPYQGSVTSFAQRVIETQAADASAARNLDDGQQIVLNAVQSRLSEQSGVNIDTELTQLIQLQTAYGANARVLSAAKEMMDVLLRAGA